MPGEEQKTRRARIRGNYENALADAGWVEDDRGKWIPPPGTSVLPASEEKVLFTAEVFEAMALQAKQERKKARAKALTGGK
mmetsp:Transcript_64258/g.152040  ORF Transcript_64258/g.152040 Transcript_64258/m.152040 type:complete len:81 (+) Transcript_64258:406-648(+)